MKYLTMVMRSGNVNEPNMMSYTLIGDDLSIHTMTGSKLAEAINTKKANVVNMAVSAQGLVSTNGSIKNYTTIGLDGALVGTPRCVILGRKEVDGKLHSYLVFNTNGTIGFMSPAEAAKLAASGMLANGKIRHTAEGDIVAAIGGTYPLFEEKSVDASKGKVDKVVVDIVFFGSALGENGKTYKYAGVITTSKNAATMAKLHKTLESANTTLRNALKAHRGYTDEQIENLAIKMAPGAGFYGVYPLENVRSIIEAAGGYKTSVRNIMIGCTDCSVSEHDESLIIYDAKDKRVVKSIPATAKADKTVKEYYEYVVSNILK